MSKSRRRPSFTPAQPPAPKLTHDERLDAASLAVDVAQERLRAEVIAARRAGLTWPAIARPLGVTPQAVQQRFGSITDRP